MVQSQCSSTESFQLFLQKARSLDLGPLAHQLMHPRSSCGWSRAKTIQGIARYLAFLYLVEQYARLQLVPTQEVDQVWHQHILDTQKYAEDCHHLFGQIIHHFPYLGTRGEADQHQWYRSYALTQVLFRKHFGTGFVDSMPADCEPLRSLPACRSTVATQPRPTVALSIEEALQFFSARD
jgi:hypothetical protein